MRSKPNHPSNDLRNFRSFLYSSKEKKEKEKINRLSRDVVLLEEGVEKVRYSFVRDFFNLVLSKRFCADSNTL